MHGRDQGYNGIGKNIIVETKDIMVETKDIMV